MMINLRHLTVMLVMCSLVSCDDQATQRNSQRQQAPVTANSLPMQGIEQMEAKLLVNPNDFETLSTLADMYFESSQFVKAFQTYDLALAVNPKCADCYNDRGLCLYYIGEPTSALESFDKAIAINPGYTHAWLSKGFVLVSEGRFQEAVAPLEKVKELDTSGVLALQADEFLAIVNQNIPQ